MERTVPSTASEEVELYLRTYYSLLRSSAEVKIRTFEEAHAGMHSLLHHAAREQSPDMSAFIYSLMRLPECMLNVQLVVMGQSSDVFERAGYGNASHWKQVRAPARRRRCFYDDQKTLACVIASRSDIDDVIPLLAAFQIEWNKLHRLLKNVDPRLMEQAGQDPQARSSLATLLVTTDEDLDRLHALWGSAFAYNLRLIAARSSDLGVRLLSGSLSDYRRATNAWWEKIERACPQIRHRPVYFVSSNTHSILNLVSGYAFHLQDELMQFLEMPENSTLKREWQDILENEVPSSRENFLYYVMKKHQQSPLGKKANRKQQGWETAHGIQRILAEHYFDVEAQIIDLSRIDVEHFDPRLKIPGMEKVQQSNALILNIDYPLGLAAYNILTEVAEHVGQVLGVYVLGKAATLNGVVGDVMLSNVVHDEHSQNTYLFGNCIDASDVAPYLVYGTVLDNQKAVSVLGTFLQNVKYMDVFYREGYTDIEMEAGPYLSAVYEMYRPKRHPVNEIITLYNLPFDLGVIHYASDTPLSKGKNLGAGSLSYYGMDSTYATSVAVLRRILRLESSRTVSG